MVSAISFGALPQKARYISENLIIGAKQRMSSLYQLKNEESVSHVIDLRNGHIFKRLKEFIVCKILGIKYISTPMIIGDKYPLSANQFERIHSLIANNHSGKTYVHCNCGRHRSMLVAAFEEFKAGKIRTFSELSEFLKSGNYFQLNKKVRMGRKVPLTPQDVQYRTNNLKYQKRKFWDMVNNISGFVLRNK